MSELRNVYVPMRWTRMRRCRGNDNVLELARPEPPSELLLGKTNKHLSDQSESGIQHCSLLHPAATKLLELDLSTGETDRVRTRKQSWIRSSNKSVFNYIKCFPGQSLSFSQWFACSVCRDPWDVTFLSNVSLSPSTHSQQEARRKKQQQLLGFGLLALCSSSWTVK